MLDIARGAPDPPHAKTSGMKWLSAGVTFVNFTTISGLLLGIVGSGLSYRSAVAALSIGVAAAILAYVRTLDTNLEPAGADSTSSKLSKRAPRRYRNIWKWLLAACFTIFAVRCFCWLLYVDGDQLKIQSPNNLGDLALHITYIRNFASGVSLWPDNPIYVFSKLRYPAGIDLFNALLYLVHVDLRQGLIWTGLLASLATFYAFYRWAGEFGVAGFLFNGGIAGFAFISTLRFQDYQDVSSIAWKSIPLTMFLTQRGLLYAIPVGLLLLWHWREKFFKIAAQDRHRTPLPFWIELSFYASMPLFHVHTFLALSIVLACLFVLECLNELNFSVDFVNKEGIDGIRSLILRPARWGEVLGDIRFRKHLLKILACAFLPATFFIWLITDHFHAASVIKWHPGWVQNEEDFARPFFEFWFLNFGVLIPLGLALIGLCGWRIWKTGWRWGERVPKELAFLFPAAVIFLFAFFVKTAPWGWDNLKIMIWAYFLVLPCLWTHLIARWSMPVRVAVCIALFGSGFVSLLGGLAAGRSGFGFANRAELDEVGVAVRKLPVEARFAAYPIYNHPLLLQGRKVVLGYPGHLWTEGFDYADTQEQLRELMEGAEDWRETARHLRVRYIFWGREEKINYPMSTRPWEKTIAPVASGNWGAIYDLQRR